MMVWGCFSWFGLGPLVLVNGNMSSEVYVNILDILWQQLETCPFLYQHANASVHRANVIASLFEITVLNLIEHLWDELEWGSLGSLVGVRGACDRVILIANKCIWNALTVLLCFLLLIIPIPWFILRVGWSIARRFPFWRQHPIFLGEKGS